MLPKRVSVLSLLAGCLLSSIAVAQPDESQVKIIADSLEKKGELFTAKGGVEITQKGLVLTADQAEIHRTDNTIKAHGNIHFQRGEDRFEGENLILNIAEDTGELSPAIVDLAGPGGKGGGGKIIRHSRNNFTIFDGTLTNCDCEKPPWEIKSKEINLDLENNQATAKHVVLYLRDIPIAYTPWWQQPLKQKRTSGLLMPSLHYSSASGFEVDIPYYFNLAPNRDMTIAANPIAKRGVNGKLEYRYLTTTSEGSLNIHGMRDNLANKDRGMIYFDHLSRFDNWGFKTHLEHVTDREYLQDFHQKVIDTSSPRLNSTFEVEKFWSGGSQESGSVRLGVDWIQDLGDENDRYTVQRLPYLTIQDSRPLGSFGSRWQLDSKLQADSFYMLTGASTQRIDVRPKISFRYPGHFGDVTAQMAIQQTSYWVHEKDDETVHSLMPEGNSSRHRQASQMALRFDGKLQKVFDRKGKSKKFSAFKHSFEPSIQYGFGSTTDQSNLPLFDPDLEILNVENLFTLDPFPGVDRVGEGNWISYAVANHFFGRKLDNGQIASLASFTVGQRWFPGGMHRNFNNDHAFSEVVAKLEISPSEDFTISGDTQYNTYDQNFSHWDALFKLKHSERKWLELAYHMDKTEEIDEGTAKFSIPINDTWKYMQEVTHSFQEDMTKGWTTRFVYTHDCWELALSGGQKLSTDNSSHGGNWVGFLLELKGLGGYGLGE